MTSTTEKNGESSPPASQSSSLRQFLTSLPSLSSDLTQITAPPFLQSPVSATILPASWAERPALLLAPTLAEDPLERARLVLKWYLASLKGLIYMGRGEDEGAKKPLNAFLGEVCVGEWDGTEQDSESGRQWGKTRLVSEQVSHHPPVTGCYIYNENAGVAAEGYTSQRVALSRPSKLSASFNITVQQIGHALLTLQRPAGASSEPEYYVVTLPTIVLKDLLSPTSASYPELQGHAYVISSAGYTARIDFSGTEGAPSSGLFSPKETKARARNYVHASLYSTKEGPSHELIMVEGNWSGRMVFKKGEGGDEFDVYDASSAPQPQKMQTPAIDDMDEWESQRAWKGVIDAIHAGDMPAVAREKSKIEESQRTMRKREGTDDGEAWQRLFFTRKEQSDSIDADIATKLLSTANVSAGGTESNSNNTSNDTTASELLGASKTNGIWRVKDEADVQQLLERRGAHRGGLRPGVTPLGYQE